MSNTTPDDEYGWLDKAILGHDPRCPECLDEGHGGDGCLYCWNNPVEQNALDKTKQQIISHIQQNYVPNSEVERVKREAALHVLQTFKSSIEANSDDTRKMLRYHLPDYDAMIELLSNKENK